MGEEFLPESIYSEISGDTEGIKGIEGTNKYYISGDYRLC